jgi:hypothetical protein
LDGRCWIGLPAHADGSANRLLNFGLDAFRVLGLKQLGLGEILLEAIDAAFRIDELLTASEKRMTVRANFHADIAFVSRTRTERVGTRTDHVDFLVVGVDACFHLWMIPFERSEVPL